MNLGCNPELLVDLNVKKENAVLPEHGAPHEVNQGVQQLLKFRCLDVSIVVEFCLLRAEQAFGFVEEVLDDRFIVEEHIGIENEPEALINKEDLILLEV